MSTGFGISELMNVRHAGAGHAARGTLTARAVAQAAFLLVAEDCFPQEPFVDTNDAMRSIVVMNGSSLTRPPADDEHLDGIIATNPVTPVVAFLETKVRLDI